MQAECVHVFTVVQDRRDGINSSVNDDVGTIIKGKTTSQLIILEKAMQKKLEGGEGIDVGMCTVSSLGAALWLLHLSNFDFGLI